ncbi:MAG TPA: radical SAM protein [Myxococcales bacterium]|jgi:DNA repair photolyase
MKALNQIPTGYAHSEPWPAHPRVEVRTARSQDVLLPIGEGPSRYFALNPYSGCEFACVWCRGRHTPPFKDADPRLFERDIHARANAVEAVTRALKDGSLERSPLVLGTQCDPWQPAEQKAQVTRGVLDVLARYGSVDLRAQTRSTLIPRDIDLLAAIGRRGKVSVSFSIPTLDLRLSKLLEPLAPSAERRLVVLETLARAGIRVGVQVAPVMHGINDSAPYLEAVLRRAQSAGASFATVTPLSMPAPARLAMVGFVSHYDPELATKYDRLLARTVETDRAFPERLQASFDQVCTRLGLAHPRRAPRKAPPPASAERQLSLF